MSQSSDFPFQKQRVEVLGHGMAYVDEGEGEPIVFLHGNPTSSYLWRGVIPHAAKIGRAIAFDMIGMGDSDKPDIAYRIYDQCDHFVGFVDDVIVRENVAVTVPTVGFAPKWTSNVKTRSALADPANNVSTATSDATYFVFIMLSLLLRGAHFKRDQYAEYFSVTLRS